LELLRAPSGHHPTTATAALRPSSDAVTQTDSLFEWTFLSHSFTHWPCSAMALKMRDLVKQEPQELLAIGKSIGFVPTKFLKSQGGTSTTDALIKVMWGGTFIPTPSLLLEHRTVVSR